VRVAWKIAFSGQRIADRDGKLKIKKQKAKLQSKNQKGKVARKKHKREKGEIAKTIGLRG